MEVMLFPSALCVVHVCLCLLFCLFATFCVSLIHIELNMAWGSQVSRVYFFCGFVCSQLIG